MTTPPATFCPLPWASVQARPDGRMSACCFYETPYQSASGEDLHLYRDTLADGLRSPTAEALRRNLLAGVRDSGCRFCWDEEARGQKSKRQHELYNLAPETERILAGNYGLEQPVFLDIATGTFCNLACRICHADVSSSWEKEATDLGLPRWPLPESLRELGATPEGRVAIRDWPRTNPRFWEEIEGWLPKIRHFNFVGGEPFLSREHFALLEKSVRAGHSRHQYLRYNTNGTIYPERWVRELFPHFAYVQVWVSLDDVGPRFEYQRYGARWEKVVANVDLLRAQEKLSVAICLTVSALNVYYLPECLEFWRAKGVKVFLGNACGDSLNVRCLPPAAKAAVLGRLEGAGLESYGEILLNRYEPILEQLRLPSVPAHWNGFVETLRVHDRYRGERYESVFPESAAVYGLS